MHCPKCGSIISDNSETCKFCKVEIKPADRQKPPQAKQTPKQIAIQKDWKNFYSLAIVFAIAHLGINGLVSSKSVSEDIFLILGVVTIGIAIGTGVLFSYYAYKFSHNKLALLTGVLGFMWGLILPVLIGALIIQNLKNKAMQTEKVKND